MTRIRTRRDPVARLVHTLENAPVSQLLRAFRELGWSVQFVVVEDPPVAPGCPYPYHDPADPDNDGTPCMCQPHGAGAAYGCPEGCPTHNPGGEDVPEAAIGGPDIPEEPTP